MIDRKTVAILISSDTCYYGKAEDTSGEQIKAIVSEYGYSVVKMLVIPREKEIIKHELKTLCDEDSVNLILTTGGTGFSQRDVTPEATLEIIEKNVPGIPEAMRTKSLVVNERAMLSRIVSGIRKKSLIINLPGYTKSIKEMLDFILPTLFYGIEILSEEDTI